MNETTRIKIAEDKFLKNPLSIFTNQYRIDLSSINQIKFHDKQLMNQKHKHRVFELCLCLFGDGTFLCGDKTYSITESCLFLGPPNIPHQIFTQKDHQLSLLFFSFTIMYTGQNETTTEDRIVQNFLKSHKILALSNEDLLLYHYIFNHYNVANQGYRSMLKAFILDCLYALSSDTPCKSEKEQIVAFIQDNLNEKLTIKQLASKFSMSERTFFYFFKENFNTTPIDYINYERMLKATTYLHMGISITDIADLFQFSDASSFCRMFKKYFAITPKQFSKIDLTLE